jgi:thioredoxin reductase
MFDVIVVGGGPAGLSAALMLGRCRRRVLVCDLGRPRNRRTNAIHGYLTRDGIAPASFTERAREELTPYGIEVRAVGVARAARVETSFRVGFTDGREEQSRFLLIATGVEDILPPIPDIDACYGRSVFHCPYCDGWEWRDRRLAVVGKGSSGVKLALSLKTWSDSVVFYTNGAPLDGAGRRLLERNGMALQARPIAGLVHDGGRLAAIRFQDGTSLPADALFFTTGQRQQSDLVTRLGCTLTRRGTVKTGRSSGTNVTGVFVAGDASHDAQFVVVAAAEGVKAAVAINQALQREELVL